MAQLLRSIHPFHTAKLIHAKTGIPVRTLERVLDGTAAPSWDTYSRLLVAYPRLLLTLGAAWAEIAVAAVELETLDRQRADLSARRERAAATMRGLR